MSFIINTGSGFFAQSNTNRSEIIEGGKVLIDLIKNLKHTSSKSTDLCKTNRTGDICFSNRSKNTILVGINKNDSINTYSNVLIIQPRNSECLYHLYTGVYNYHIQSDSSHITLQKGQIALDQCNVIEKRIK
jgi:hypothetical protein